MTGSFTVKNPGVATQAKFLIDPGNQFPETSEDDNDNVCDLP
jgi:hypothetical protein